jgi:tRNA(His) 5'-end guanylyltransferase
MANKRDSLGDRMKNYYENRAKTYLVRRMPVIVRLDGKAFHTFTRGFDKPFDKVLMKAMQETTLKLCQKIQGCVLGYTQSDEITLVLVDYNDINTDAWFDYSVQKMCSVAASMCTLYFNHKFIDAYAEWFTDAYSKVEVSEDAHKFNKVYEKAIEKGAMFDARVFNIPVEEVTNCVLWRQQDATRNSISSLAQSKFSYRELHGKNSSQMQDMLMDNFGINWNNLTVPEKRGTAVIKKDGEWTIDYNMPILKGEDRNYVDNLIKFENED